MYIYIYIYMYTYTCRCINACIYIHTYIHVPVSALGSYYHTHYYYTFLLHIITTHHAKNSSALGSYYHTFTAHYYYTPCHIIATHFTAHYYYTPLQEQWCSWLLLPHTLLHTLLLHTMPRTVVLLSALLACLAVTEPDFTVSYIFF